MSDDAEVVGTVCVAPRARSANRRVYFLELQGDDETRHHVLCKATQLGGLLPDEITVHRMHHAPCTHHAPRLCTRDTYQRATHTTHVHAHITHTCHAHACHAYAQVALHRDLRQGDTLAVRVGRRELCAAPPEDRDCNPICAMEAALLSYQVRWQGRARADSHPPRRPREHSEHRC